MISSKNSTPRGGEETGFSPQEIDKLVTLFNQKRYAEMEALAREMTVRFPNYGIGWKAMGTALLQQERNDEALAPLQKAADLSPKDAQPHNSLGNALLKLNRLPEAEASLRLALELKPDYAEAHYNLGNTLQKLGLLSKAEASYRRALEFKPDLAETHCKLGDAFGAQDKMIDAEASYRRALELKPDFAEAHCHLGSMLQKLGRLSEAEASYRRANLEKFNKHLFIVGAQKAGTTSLYSYLNQRPEMVGGGLKEKVFFSLDSSYAMGNNHYRSLFPTLLPMGSSHSWGMDATPEYLYHRECANRIHAFDPDAKIIILLREPVSRAFSAFNMYHQLVRREQFRQRIKFMNKPAQDFFMPIVEGKVESSLDYYLDRELQIMKENHVTEEPSLIRRGLYAPQLESYIRLFGRENVLILFSNDLKMNTHNTVNRVCEFIGLEPFSYRQYPMQHAREYTVDQSGKELISQIASELFAKDKLELTHTYGLDVPW